jgi:hypothetical protein
VIARAENGLDLLGLSVDAKRIATRLMPFFSQCPSIFDGAEGLLM